MVKRFLINFEEDLVKTVHMLLWTSSLAAVPVVSIQCN